MLFKLRDTAGAIKAASEIEDPGYRSERLSGLRDTVGAIKAASEIEDPGYRKARLMEIFHHYAK
jgi:hypothetical protein